MSLHLKCLDTFSMSFRYLMVFRCDSSLRDTFVKNSSPTSPQYSRFTAHYVYLYADDAELYIGKTGQLWRRDLDAVPNLLEE